MSSKLKRETITKDVWVTKPISETAVHEAYDVFRSQYIDPPEQLVMHPEARAEFLMQLKGYDRLLDTYNGMLLVVDYDFEEHEWCVRRSVSKTFAVN